METLKMIGYTLLLVYIALLLTVHNSEAQVPCYNGTCPMSGPGPVYDSPAIPHFGGGGIPSYGGSGNYGNSNGNGNVHETVHSDSDGFDRETTVTYPTDTSHTSNNNNHSIWETRSGTDSGNNTYRKVQAGALLLNTVTGFWGRVRTQPEPQIVVVQQRVPQPQDDVPVEVGGQDCFVRNGKLHCPYEARSRGLWGR